MAIPKYNELFQSVLHILEDGEEHSAKSMTAPICDEFALDDEERQELLPSQRQTVIANRIGWARTYLKKAGLISSPKRGVYVITQLGKDALASRNSITSDYLAQFKSFRDFVSVQPENKQESEQTVSLVPSLSSDASNGDTPEEEINHAMELINKQLADDLLEEIAKISPIAFERFVLDLMGALGYGEVKESRQVTPPSNDEGIDGIIIEDKLGFDLIYVQAKHYQADKAVSRPEVQSFAGAIAGRNGRGLFVTTSSFSKPAQEYANRQHIVLIDGQELTQLMIKNDFGVTTRRTFCIKTLDTDLFEDYREN